MNNNSKMLRAFYIILIPIVLLMILLNSGLLQRVFTAATVYGEKYSAVRYNYYYFSVYEDFLADGLADSDYDASAAAGAQQYDENTTWKEHFVQLAQERMILAAYYNKLAQEAGYVFTEKELAPVQEKLDEISQLCSDNGVKESNYYSAYYGSGMNVTRFTEELIYEVQGQAYRAYLESQWQADPSDVADWLSANPTEDHALTDLWLIELDAVPSRSTGQVGEQQLTDLSQRLARLADRQAQGADMAALAGYGDVLWGTDGLVENADRADLPELVADWCFADGRQVGDVTTLLDETEGKAYLVLIADLNGSSAQKTAQEALSQIAMDQMEEQALAEAPVEYHSMGMQLTTV
jgi:hypothetical protein